MRSSEIQAAILARHNEGAADNNPNFNGWKVVPHGEHGYAVDFFYTRPGTSDTTTKTFNGRVWS